jgi:DegV family protein with EDD domain
MSKVAIVADSTSYIPQKLIQEYGIRVVPLVVIWSGEEFLDGVDIQPDEFYTRLQNAREMPSTSQPTPAAMQKVFGELLEDGYDILGVFISQKLSGTVASAVQAKAMFPDANIEIVDSAQAAMGAGWPIIAGARAAASGATLEECKAIVEAGCKQADIFFVLDTLEFMHRGGRIGGATRFLGTMLNSKPILEIKDGAIEALERVRTHRKAVNRLLELLEERIGGREPLYLAIIHANVPEAARELHDRAVSRTNPVESAITEVSPVIGTHVGPGTLGFAFMVGVD